MTRGRGLLWILSALLLALAMGGCGGGSVEGDWVLDTEATRANIKPAIEKQIKDNMGDQAAKAAAALEPMVNKAVDGMMKGLAMTMSFKGDGTCTLDGTMGGSKNLATGTWTQSGSEITVEVTDKKNKKETFTLRLDGGKLLMDIAQKDTTGKTPKIDLVLKRK